MGITLNSFPQVIIKQATAPTATAGVLWWDTDDLLLYYYTGSAWVQISSASDAAGFESMVAQLSLELLRLSAEGVLTAPDYDNMFIDYFSDATGQDNTIDTANTTASFSSASYTNDGSVAVGKHYYKFDEGSGTTCADSGTAADKALGSLTTGNFNASGKFDDCYKPANEAIETNFTLADLEDGSGCSISFWCKRATTLSSDDAVVGNDHNGSFPSNGSFVLQVKNGSTTDLVMRYKDDTSTKITGGVTISDSVFSHVCYVLESDGITEYLDGSIVGSKIAMTNAAFLASTMKLFSLQAAYQLTDLYMDEIKFHNTALAAGEVADLAAATSETGGTPANALVQTNAQALSFAPAYAFVHVKDITLAGTGAATFDISYDGGSTWDSEGNALDTKIASVDSSGKSMVIQINLTGTGSGNTSTIKDYEVILWSS